jgi:hypothetical protein
MVPVPGIVQGRCFLNEGTKMPLPEVTFSVNLVAKSVKMK